MNSKAISVHKSGGMKENGGNKGGSSITNKRSFVRNEIKGSGRET
jgi:hypothetical protein